MNSCREIKLIQTRNVIIVSQCALQILPPPPPTTSHRHFILDFASINVSNTYDRRELGIKTNENKNDPIRIGVKDYLLIEFIDSIPRGGLDFVYIIDQAIRRN